MGGWGMGVSSILNVCGALNLNLYEDIYFRGSISENFGYNRKILTGFYLLA